MRTAIIVGFIASLAACGGGVTSSSAGSSSAAIDVAPDPSPTVSCSEAPRPSPDRHFAVEDRGHNMVLVLIDGKPLCLDTLEGATRSNVLPGSLGDDGAPLKGGSGSSSTDPMPAKGSTQGNTDPMPADGKREN